MRFLIDIPFGAANPKFAMGGMVFENQQGMGAAAPGMMGNEMVMYPIFGDFLSF